MERYKVHTPYIRVGRCLAYSARFHILGATTHLRMDVVGSSLEGGLRSRW